MTTQTWKIDNAHSSIAFTVRHMVVTKVHGRFSKYEGSLALDGEAIEGGTAEVTIDASSIDTNVADRDAHLRSPDFFDVAKFPKLSFRSRRVESAGRGKYRVIGNLTIRDVTREVVLETEYLGRMKDPFGNTKVAFSATTSIDRKDFGLTWNAALETGGVLVADRVDIAVEVQAVKAAASGEQQAA